MMGHAYATDARGCFSLRERIWSPSPGPSVMVEKQGYRMNVFGFPAGAKKVSVILASSSSSERTASRVVADLLSCR